MADNPRRGRAAGEPPRVVGRRRRGGGDGGRAGALRRRGDAAFVVAEDRLRALPAGEGWPGWTCPGVANLRRGKAKACSRPAPTSSRATRGRSPSRSTSASVDGEIAAPIVARPARAPGSSCAASARATTTPRSTTTSRPRSSSCGASPDGRGRSSAAPPVRAAAGPLRLTFGARGAHPTVLAATLATERPAATVTARDAAPRAPARRRPRRARHRAHAVPERRARRCCPRSATSTSCPTGCRRARPCCETRRSAQQVLATIRERSTAAFAEIARPRRRPARGQRGRRSSPRRHGAAVPRGALAARRHRRPRRASRSSSPTDPRFRGSRRLAARPHRRLRRGLLASVRTCAPGRRVYWRARLRRDGRETVGPVRSFRVLPRAGSRRPRTIAVGACAAQFGPIFDQLAARAPDVFVWQGDLNYPDTLGPLAQTVPGYAGIWRDFLANPRLAPAPRAHALRRPARRPRLRRPGRERHEPRAVGPRAVGGADGAAPLLPLHGRAGRRSGCSTSAASRPTRPRRTRRTRRCSAPASAPGCCGRSPPRGRPSRSSARPARSRRCRANARDGSWAAGFTAERDLLLDAHPRARQRAARSSSPATPTGRWSTTATACSRRGPARSASRRRTTSRSPSRRPPRTRAAQPGVAYADDERGHFALIEVGVTRRRPARPRARAGRQRDRLPQALRAAVAVVGASPLSRRAASGVQRWNPRSHGVLLRHRLLPQPHGFEGV